MSSTVTVDEVDGKILLQCLRSIIPTTSKLDDSRLIKKIGQERYEDAVNELFGYIETGVSTPLSKMEKDALASKLIRCLSDYMRLQMQPPMPVTLKTIIDCLQMISLSTEQAFPNYHASKLLRYVI